MVPLAPVRHAPGMQGFARSHVGKDSRNVVIKFRRQLLADSSCLFHNRIIHHQINPPVALPAYKSSASHNPTLCISRLFSFRFVRSQYACSSTSTDIVRVFNEAHRRQYRGGVGGCFLPRLDNRRNWLLCKSHHRHEHHAEKQTSIVKSHSRILSNERHLSSIGPNSGFIP